MILKKWSDLPENLRNNKTKEYYDILENKRISLLIKRLLDIILSFIMLVFLIPVFLIISIAIKLESKGTIFYRQERITQYGRSFKIFKFRTMIQNADRIGTLVTLENDSRITKVGKIIRKVRLDELPQIINILTGDMTFVGTRPEVKKYVEQYNEEMKATLLLPAGVTSRASIEYSNEDEEISKYNLEENDVDYIYINKILPEKMKHNLNYIKSFNLLEDIKITISTIFIIFKIGKRKVTNEKNVNKNVKNKEKQTINK